MKNTSRQRKASMLQNHVRKKILKCFPHLKYFDVKTAKVGENGPDLVLSDVAKKLVGCQFETKNQNKMRTIYSWYKQASKNTKLTPVVVMKCNSREPLVCVSFEHFMNLIRS